ncbi:hypothetical protein H5410_028388 [Solanum commersonii]|uniref:Uncharacterized protein n=1 Tax=Solanum commersonii TaxID=4109 RepID=A0A9J5Z4N9_SOLCO|nr:hypothetical protein H5410_028388 [Solanum commersonii]
MLLKSRSGLSYQYSDRRIFVDVLKAWNDLIKVDPNVKSMSLKNDHCLLIGKRSFARIELLGSLPIDDASGTRDDQVAQEKPNVSTGEIQNSLYCSR